MKVPFPGTQGEDAFISLKPYSRILSGLASLLETVDPSPRSGVSFHEINVM